MTNYLLILFLSLLFISCVPRSDHSDINTNRYQVGDICRLGTEYAQVTALHANSRYVVRISKPGGSRSRNRDVVSSSELFDCKSPEDFYAEYD